MNSQAKILIVDDEADARNFVEHTLGQHYSVTTVPSGEDALVFLEDDHKIDVMLLDIMMPGLDGFEVLEMVKANPKTQSIRVIMLTAINRVEDKIKAFANGAVDFIVKPFEKGELVARLETQVKLKRAEQKIREAETKYRTLVEQLPAITYLVEFSQVPRTVYISPQVETLLGFSQAEWLAAPDLWQKQLHPEDREMVLAEVHEKDKLGQPLCLDYRMLSRDNRVIWFRNQSTLIRSDTGQLHFSLGVMLDISERKQVEKALRDSEERYRLLAENINDLITKFTVDGVYTYVSPACRNILGYEPEEMVGRSFYDFIHPEDLADIQAMNPPLWAPDTTSIFTLHFRRKDGDYIWLESNVRGGQTLETKRGEMLAVARNVTERKRYEVALQEAHDKLERRVEERTVELLAANALLKQEIQERKQAERRYRDLFEEAPVMYVITRNQQGFPTIAGCNDLFLATLGYSRAEVLRRPLADFYTPESQADLLASGYEQTLTGNSAAQERDLLTRDGKTIPTLLRVTPEIETDGRFFGTRAMYVDISERKQMEAALEKERATLARRVQERTAELSAANAELARTSRLKDEFLTSMSHELRTPLNAILGISEALQEHVYGPLNDQHLQALSNIEESGRHLLMLINDILDLSKIEAGKLQLEPNWISLEEVCQASLRFVKQAAHKKNIKVSSIFNANAPERILGDERRLKQVLVNLLSNAVKFTPEGGSIGLEVAGSEDRQAVHLTVWDTGIGISAEQMPQLFQPFIQLDSSLSRRYAGTGLGLVLVRRIVEMHGGSITLESEVGQGSRFTVSLACQADDRDPVSAFTAAEQPIPPGHWRVQRALVIEDSAVVADQYTRYLGELGIETTVHLQGAGAVEQALKLQPDVIILDILLPDIPGWDILAQLHAHEATRAIPVLVVSVLDERPQGLAYGAVEYFTKPISRYQLQQTLNHISAAAQKTLVPVAASPGQNSGNGTAPKVQPLILLAEDNELNINTLSDFLVNQGYRLIVTRNGKEAVSRTREEKPDIILMDIQMPEVDGLEAIRRLRQDAAPNIATIPIIAITALAMPGDRERCLAAGANDYISKPISLKGLVKAIGSQLKTASYPDGRLPGHKQQGEPR